MFRGDVHCIKWRDIALIVIIIFIAYGTTLFSGFLYDDFQVVLQNPWIVNISFLGEIFNSHLWEFVETDEVANYYRPTLHLSFMLSRKIAGLNAWGYHLVNIVLHTINSILVLVIASFLLNIKSSKITCNSTPEHSDLPVIAALIFALNPVNSEVVCWVSSQSDMIFSLFFLIAVILHIYSDRVTSLSTFFILVFLTSFAYFAALLSKETAIVFITLGLSYDLIFRRSTLYRYFVRYIGYLIAIVAYLLLRMNAIGTLSYEDVGGYSLYELIINAPVLSIKYLLLLLIPLNLSVGYSFDIYSALLSPWVIISIVLILIAVALLIYYRDNSRLLFLTAWLVLPLLPVLNLSAITGGETAFHDRYVYLSSGAFSILIVLLISRFTSINSLSNAFKGRHKSIMISLSLLMAFYLVSSIARTKTWKNAFNLWSYEVSRKPNATNTYNLALEYLNLNDRSRAISLFKKSVEINPNNENSIYNLGWIYQDEGKLDEALYFYNRAIQLAPKKPDTHYNLAIIYLKQGKTAAGKRELENVLALDPAYSAARRELNRLR